MKSFIFGLLAIIVLLSAGFSAGQWRSQNPDTDLLSPFISPVETEKELPLLNFTINKLRDYPFEPREIAITGVIQEYPDYTAYEFTYQPLGASMSGQLNVPKELSAQSKAIVMVRGWAPSDIYYTGMGTKNAAAVFAQNGYITLAPDFFGYGKSAPEPDDTWLARFQKPMVVIELIKSIETNGVPVASDSADTRKTGDIGIWAHSNGGQITLTALEILSEPYPATLWAPVVAPFPYSVLFFSDEDADEGKDFRKYVSQFEQDYDVFEYSITQRLNLLTGPFQLHHGTADTAALYTWSDEFIDKVIAENKRRLNLSEQIEELWAQEATDSAVELAEDQILEPIEYKYFKYPGADHNLVPSWNIAIERDLLFFADRL